jgi:hypothetical protein
VSALLPAAMARIRQGLPVPDRIVPSPFASHVLLEALRRVAAPAARIADPSETAPLFAAIETPFHHLLPNGNAALSFATWVCPVNCIEPVTCPAISGPLDWEMASAVRIGLGPTTAGLRSLHVLACLHEAFGVGTIPVADLAREALTLQAAAARFDEDRRSKDVAGYAVVATVSTCHGLAGALRL